MRRIIAALLVLAISGCCNKIPFTPVELVSEKGINPETVRLQFAQRLPQRFEVLNSTLFTCGGQKIACLGPANVDASEQTVTVVGMNHVGVKLFELSFHRGIAEKKYVFPALTRQGDLGTAVVQDISRIYFDRLPHPESAVEHKKNSIVFRQAQDNGFLEYVFAGRDNFLIEKNFYAKGRKIWSVFYYEYVEHNGKIFPAGAILRHHRYRYDLTIRLKEIRKSE